MVGPKIRTASPEPALEALNRLCIHVKRKCVRKVSESLMRSSSVVVAEETTQFFFRMPVFEKHAKLSCSLGLCCIWYLRFPLPQSWDRCLTSFLWWSWESRLLIPFCSLARRFQSLWQQMLANFHDLEFGGKMICARSYSSFIVIAAQQCYLDEIKI